MFLWFLGTAIVSVWYVFRDPRFDYRLLLLGSVLPDVIDVPLSRARWAHSLTTSVVVLVAVMLLTVGRKPIRRCLLGLPIGMLLHLVWDGAFTATRVFWWPFSGSWRTAQVPSLERGLVLNLAMECAGAGLLLWVVRRFGLADAARRRRFVTDGLLEDPASRAV